MTAEREPSFHGYNGNVGMSGCNHRIVDTWVIDDEHPDAGTVVAWGCRFCRREFAPKDVASPLDYDHVATEMARKGLTLIATSEIAALREALGPPRHKIGEPCGDWMGGPYVCGCAAPTRAPSEPHELRALLAGDTP